MASLRSNSVSTRILVYGNRKCDDTAFDISTPEKESAAYLVLLHLLDFQWNVYTDLDEIEDIEVCAPCQNNLHDYCAAGIRSAVPCACHATKNCEDRSKQALHQNHQQKVWAKWLGEARGGNAESAKKLLRERSRKGFEYEVFSFSSVTDPQEELRALEMRKAIARGAKQSDAS